MAIIQDSIYTNFLLKFNAANIQNLFITFQIFFDLIVSY